MIILILVRWSANSRTGWFRRKLQWRAGGADLTTRRITKELYETARALQKEPLSALAARGLLDRVKPRDTVLNPAPASPIRPRWSPKATGRSAQRTLAVRWRSRLHATPVFLTEVTNIPRLAALVRATGLDIVDLELAKHHAVQGRRSCRCRSIRSAPPWSAKGDSDRAKPKAMVSIEKPAPTPACTYHTGPGPRRQRRGRQGRHLRR